MNTIFTKFLIFLLITLTYFLVIIVLPNAYKVQIPHILTAISFSLLALIFAVINLKLKKNSLSWLTLICSILGSTLTGLLFGAPIGILAILSKREYSKIAKTSKTSEA